MARASPISLDGISEDYEESVLTDRTFDSIDELLSRFTLDFQPEYMLKIRNRLGPIIVGVDASHLPEDRKTSGAILFKPANQRAWWRRLRLASNGEVTLRSRKLRWWVFTLDLQGHANPLNHTTSASFRVATKWDLSRGEYRNKRITRLGDATEGRVHWNVNYNLPEVEGSFGANDQDVSQEMHAEVGYAHAEVNKVELVVWPWRNNPKWAPPPSITNIPSNAVVTNGSGSDSYASEEDSEGAGSTAVVVRGSKDTGRKKDWVGQGLTDLQEHIADLQEWWETRQSSTDTIAHKITSLDDINSKA